MLGLQIYLSQKMLSKGRHKVHVEIQRRIGPGGREAQSSYSAQIRGYDEHGCKLVLSLRLYATCWEEECSKVYR